jgi:hypothetical protein
MRYGASQSASLLFSDSTNLSGGRDNPWIHSHYLLTSRSRSHYSTYPSWIGRPEPVSGPESVVAVNGTCTTSQKCGVQPQYHHAAHCIQLAPHQKMHIWLGSIELLYLPLFSQACEWSIVDCTCSKLRQHRRARSPGLTEAITQLC